MTVFRGISESAYKKIVDKGFKQGSIISSKRFTSTSKDLGVALDYTDKGKRTIISYDIPKGTHALDYAVYGKEWEEEENQIVFSTNQKIFVESIEEDSDVRLIKCRLL